MRNDDTYRGTRINNPYGGVTIDDSHMHLAHDESFIPGLSMPLLMFLAGLGTGAALMYLLDPDRGRRRRALIRDQAIGLTNDAREALNATAGDLSNRAYGLYADTRRAVAGGSAQSDAAGQSDADRSRTSETDRATETGNNPGISRTASQS